MSLAELCSGKKEYEGAAKSEKSFILKSYFWQELSVFYEKFDCLKNIWCRLTPSPSSLNITVPCQVRSVTLISFTKPHPCSRKKWKTILKIQDLDIHVSFGLTTLISYSDLVQVNKQNCRSAKVMSTFWLPYLIFLQMIQAPPLPCLVSTCPVSSLSPVLAVNLREAKNLKNWHTQTISKNVWKVKANFLWLVLNIFIFSFDCN